MHRKEKWSTGMIPLWEEWVTKTRLWEKEGKTVGKVTKDGQHLGLAVNWKMRSAQNSQRGVQNFDLRLRGTALKVFTVDEFACEGKTTSTVARGHNVPTFEGELFVFSFTKATFKGEVAYRYVPTLEERVAKTRLWEKDGEQWEGWQRGGQQKNDLSTFRLRCEKRA